jgi:hypothetical protein
VCVRRIKEFYNLCVALQSIRLHLSIYLTPAHSLPNITPDNRQYHHISVYAHHSRVMLHSGSVWTLPLRGIEPLFLDRIFRRVANVMIEVMVQHHEIIMFNGEQNSPPSISPSLYG